MQQENIDHKTEFYVKRSSRITDLIPMAYVALAAGLGDFWLASLIIVVIGVAVFFLRKRPHIITDENGIYYRTFFRMKRIKWEEIYRIKVNMLGGVAIYWGDKGKNQFRTFRLQWRPAKTLKIWKEIRGFRRLLKTVLKKSVDAEVAPGVFELLNTPNKQKINRYRWGFASFFLLLLITSLYMLLKLVHTPGTMGYNHIFLISFLPPLGGLSGMFFSRFLYIWDEGDKWSDLGLLYGLFTFSPVLTIIVLFTYSLAVWSVVVTTTFLAFSMLIFCFPTLSRSKMAGLMLVFVLLAVTGGKICLYNPHVERSTLKQLDNFYCTAIGWFPDAQRIWLTGRVTTFYAGDGGDSNDDSEDLVILDTESGRIAHRMPVDAILPSFSFHWSPDGTQLALVEFPREKDRILSLVDTGSFEKTPLLEAKDILLHEYGSWNKEGTKLVGVHRNARSDNDESRVVFLIDVAEQRVSELVEIERAERTVCHFEEGDLLDINRRLYDQEI